MPDERLPPHVQSLLAAVEARPDDLPLRLHTAELLITHEEPARAATMCAAVWSATRRTPRPCGCSPRRPRSCAGQRRRPKPPRTCRRSSTGRWRKARSPTSPSRSSSARRNDDLEPEPDVERSSIRLADVGGMTDVKRRLDLAFLRPMRNPELKEALQAKPGGWAAPVWPARLWQDLPRPRARRRARRELLRGVAGGRAGHVDRRERAQSQSRSSRSHGATRPCVLFLDEIDALGQKRSHLREQLGYARNREPAARRDGLRRRTTTTPSSSSARPTTRGMSTPPCCDRAGSTGRCS